MRTRLPANLEAIAVRKVDLIRATVPTNRRERQVIAELVRSGLHEAFTAGRIEASTKTAADAWDEGDFHQARFLNGRMYRWVDVLDLAGSAAA